MSTSPRTTALIRRYRHIGSGVLDAGLASARNFILALVAARSLDLGGFGRFSTGVLVILLALGAMKALHADPLVIVHAGREHHAWGKAVAHAIGAALATSLTAAAVGLLAALSLWARGAQTPGSVVAAASIILPGVVVQDALRWVAHAVERGGSAVASNLTWTGFSLATIGVLKLSGVRDGSGWWMLAWGIGAVPAAIVLGWTLRHRPAPRQSIRWYADHRALSSNLLMDWLMLQVTAEGALVLIAALTSAEGIGALRKAQLPLAPIIVLTTGLIIYLQPALARARTRGDSLGSLRATVLRAAVLVGTAALGLGMAVWALPSSLVSDFVGGDWEVARTYVVPLSIALAAGAVGGALGVGLRVMGALRAQVRLRLWVSPISLTVTGVCAATLGVAAAAWSIAFTTLAVAMIWLVMLLRLRHMESPQGVPVTTRDGATA